MYNIEINEKDFEVKEKKEILDLLTEQSVIRIYEKQDFESDYKEDCEEESAEERLLSEAYKSSDTLVCVTYPHISTKGIICERNNIDSIITFASSSPYHQIILREDGKIIISSLYRPQWAKKYVQEDDVFI